MRRRRRRERGRGGGGSACFAVLTTEGKWKI